MDKFNNMGGFVALEIITLRDIDVMCVVDGEAYLKLTAGSSWQVLPIHAQNIQAPDVQQTDNGYTISAKLTMRGSKLSTSDISLLNKRIVEGCLLRGKTANGEYYLYGCINYPLFGTVQKTIGKNKTDLTCVTLNLSAKTTYPPALIAEL